jgi:hypothetical protein
VWWYVHGICARRAALEAVHTCVCHCVRTLELLYSTLCVVPSGTVERSYTDRIQSQKSPLVSHCDSLSTVTCYRAVDTITAFIPRHEVDTVIFVPSDTMVDFDKRRGLCPIGRPVGKKDGKEHSTSSASAAAHYYHRAAAAVVRVGSNLGYVGGGHIKVIVDNVFTSIAQSGG